MAQFLLSGVLFMLAFLVPLLILPIGAALVYRLRLKNASSDNELVERQRRDFNIFKYVIYLLAIPAIMLVTSVIIGYTFGTPAVLDSMIWLIVAITIAFTWCILQLVKHVSAKSRLDTGSAG